MAQLSDDCFAGDQALIRLDDALRILHERIDRVAEPETCALADALGRILSEDLIAGRSVPPHDNSAVDGYAVYADDLSSDKPTTLRIAGRAAAGHPFPGRVPRGGAVRIFTGAPMPDGPDTVMMQEDATEDGQGSVSLMPGIKPGANRRFAGEDVAAGDTVLSAGTRLSAADLGLAASVGFPQLPVFRRLRVALFSTGDELREPGSETPPGTVYDSNRYTLKALLQGLGADVTDLGILPDNARTIRVALEAAAGAHDLLVTSGGMSVGEEDHVGTAIEALGKLHFWRLAIKPGRPVALGQVNRTPLIGLPGNPVAVVVTFVHIARPIILRLAGAAEETPLLIPVTADFSHRKKPERREWLRARLSRDAHGRLIAQKFERQGAGILSSIAASDGLVEIDEDTTHIESGQQVAFLPFSELGL